MRIVVSVYRCLDSTRDKYWIDFAYRQ